MGGMHSGAEAVMAEQCTGRGAHGVVVAAAPAAAAIGASMLRSGGNAYDALVAAALAEVVLLPPKCGLGGDLIALRLRPDARAPDALLGIGPAPSRLGSTVLERGLPPTGPLSVGVPGSPAGYAALIEAGTMGRAAVAAPAIELARGGFAWSPICTVLAEEAAALVAEHSPGTRFYPDGQPPRPGELMTLPGLALVLEEWVDHGEALFAGRIGAAVAARVQAAGGVIDHDDLTATKADWVPAARATVAGWDLWATPAPTHGASLLDAVEGLDPSEDAGELLARIRAAVARRTATAGDPLVPSATSMVCAADRDGTVVALVHSNSFPQFGSGLVVDEYDLILANRAGRGFSSEEGHPNFPLPGRRPVTTLHAWAAGPAGNPPCVLGGTPGGVNQMPWNVQTLRDLLAGCTDPGRLTVAPKWEWLPEQNVVRVEEGVHATDCMALGREGVTVHDVARWDLRSAQQIVARPLPGEPIVGAVDPRTGGLALGV